MSFYLPELDGLRFFAFFLVFAQHCGNLGELSKNGWMGVDLFFVLSSFLVTELLLREKERFGSINRYRFWIRRVLRIWPIYFIYIAIEYFAIDWNYTREMLISKLLFVENIRRAISSGPWGFSSHLWTVSMEEQFYLFWPLTMAASSTQSIPLVASLMILFSFLARIIIPEFHASTSWAVNCNPFTKLDPFALGALICLLWRNRAQEYLERKFKNVFGLFIFISGIVIIWFCAKFMPRSKIPDRLNAYFFW